MSQESFLARYDAMAAMLRRLEWSSGETGDLCPRCGWRQPTHGRDCDLASLLKDLP